MFNEIFFKYPLIKRHYVKKNELKLEINSLRLAEFSKLRI